jgi:hypothetical protein
MRAIRPEVQPVARFQFTCVVSGNAGFHAILSSHFLPPLLSCWLKKTTGRAQPHWEFRACAHSKI